MTGKYNNYMKDERQNFLKLDVGLLDGKDIWHVIK